MVVFTITGAAALVVLTQLEIIRDKYGWQVRARNSTCTGVTL